MNENSMGPVFVINADDLGLADSANEGIFRAHMSGTVTSASLVVTTPALDNAMSVIERSPDLGIGLHFSLSAGQCVAPRSHVADLVDREGFFQCRFTPLFVALASDKRDVILNQIEVELEAQICRMQQLGLTPDHINGERHIHMLPGIIDLVRQAAIRHNIGHVRMIDDIGLSYLHAGDLALSAVNGGLLKYALLRHLTKKAKTKWAQPKYDNVRYASMLFTGRMDMLLPRMFAQPPPGITELAVHPGVPGVGSYHGLGNDALARYLQSNDRQLELDGCIASSACHTTARLSTFAELRSPEYA